MAVTEAGTRVKEAAAGSAIVRPWRPPSTGIAATGYGFVEVLMASPTLIATGKSGDWSSAAGRKLPATGGAMLCCVLYMHQCNAFMLCLFAPVSLYIRLPRSRYVHIRIVPISYMNCMKYMKYCYM